MSRTTTTTPHAPRSDGNAAYPFTDAATFTSRDGRTISRQVFSDAIVYPTGAAEDVHISRIDITDQDVEVTLQDSQRGLVATGFPGLLDEYGRDAGLLVADTDQFRSEFASPTTLRFGSEALPFVASVVVPRPVNHVTGLRLPDGQVVAGEVWLVGEDGVVLEYVNPDEVVVHAIGDRYSVRRFCEEGGQTFDAPRAVKSIEVQKEAQKDDGTVYQGTVYQVDPDQWGNIQITQGTGVSQDNVIRLEPTTNGLQVRVLGNFD